MQSAETNPYHLQKQRAISHAYDVFGRYEISSSLQVCHCPVCMDEETRVEIINTPVRNMPSRLIKEYSNSAHGIPTNADDLKALLPRYMDLITQGEEVDYNGVGTQLLRFGDAIRAVPNFFTPIEEAAFHDWAYAQLMWEMWDSVHDEDSWSIPSSFTEVIVCGGIPAPLVMSWWDAAMDGHIWGAQLIIDEARYLWNVAKPKDALWDHDVFALGYTEEATIQAYYAWLNAPIWQERLVKVANDTTSNDDAQMLSQMMDVFGKFNPGATKRHRQEDQA